MGKPKNATPPTDHAKINQECKSAGQKLGLRLENLRPMKGGQQMEASFRDRTGKQIKCCVRPDGTRQHIEQGLRKICGS